MRVTIDNPDKSVYNLIKWLKGAIGDKNYRRYYSLSGIKVTGNLVMSTDGYVALIGNLKEKILDDGLYSIETINKKIVVFDSYEYAYPDFKATLGAYYYKPNATDRFAVDLRKFAQVAGKFSQSSIMINNMAYVIELHDANNDYPDGEYMAVVMGLRDIPMDFTAWHKFMED